VFRLEPLHRAAKSSRVISGLGWAHALPRSQALPLSIQTPGDH